MDGKKINIGDTIFVVESEWTDAENRIIHHVENYSKMAVDKKYTLY
jgi:hypothetical protein